MEEEGAMGKATEAPVLLQDPTGEATVSRRRTDRGHRTVPLHMDSSRQATAGESTAPVPAPLPTATEATSSSTPPMARPLSTRPPTTLTFLHLAGDTRCLQRRGGGTIAAPQALLLPLQTALISRVLAITVPLHLAVETSDPRQGRRWTFRWTRSRTTRTVRATRIRRHMAARTNSRNTRGPTSSRTSSRSSRMATTTHTMPTTPNRAQTTRTTLPWPTIFPRTWRR
mmetsp:Transcript_25538/g.59232  ORF Transcript_25538/g.59232 Transcript_25538/m.59232 type:complete len:227 (+) Transcript_25538:65-745(+)